MDPRPLIHSGLALLLVACAASSERPGFLDETPPPGSEQAEPAKTGPTDDFGKQAPPATTEEIEVHEVYGHSATTLYKLEPKTKAVTVIGDFKQCESIQDIALDAKSTLYGVSRAVLYTIDKSTATCTKLHDGEFPNSLSFVPKGTVDANEEALVGYDKGDYVRIDIKTGARSVIGKLNAGDGVASSGDIASVKGGKTFLTVKGGSSCTKNDCLFEIDPTTGARVHDWGSIEHKNVFGLSFWGGKVYGFDQTGNLFEVTFGSNKIVTTTIPIPQKPADLEFWGAGSSTSAPLETGPQ